MTTMGMTWLREGTDGGSAVHQPFPAADVREGEPIAARLRVSGNGASEQTLRVWRLSPAGAELLDAAGSAVTVGTEIELALAVAGTEARLGGHVTSLEEGPLGTLIGVRWRGSQTGERPEQERRSVRRWACGSDFFPTGVATYPAHFDDSIRFRVVELSRDGMRIVTSLPNRFVVPGMRLKSTVSFPTIGDLRAELEVVHAQTLPEGADGEVAVGVRLTDPSPRSRQVFGQYVLQFGEDAMLEELREAGLRVNSCSRAVEFGCVRSLDDYSKVLRLRKMAYIGASKLPPDAYTQDTADAFDKRARILLGHHRDQVVASMRLMFHGPDDPMEHEQFVELPADLPSKQDLIEITRVCTHPGYRGGDLLFELFRHAIVTSVQSRRRWILGSSTPKLLGLYKRIGCQITDLRYNHEALAGEEHVIFIGDVHRALTGRGVNPLVWNAIFAPVWDYLDVPSFVQVSAPAKVRLAVYRGFGPLTRALARRAERRRSNKSRS